jgi:hypothetical protein
MCFCGLKESLPDGEPGIAHTREAQAFLGLTLHFLTAPRRFDGFGTNPAYACADMNEELSESDWQELAQLIEDAPLGRLQVAMSYLPLARASRTHAPAPRLLTGVDRLVHFAAMSSGRAFDRALLVHLRRLSVH